MSLLHVFDLDGTLLRGSSASLELASTLDCQPALHALEASFAVGELDTRGFATALHQLFGQLMPSDVAAAFAAAPWIAGIREVWAEIRRLREHSLLITMSPDFFARLLLDLGVDEVRASSFPDPPFRTALDPDLILTPADKVRISAGVLARLGLTWDQCIAYGDSLSDGPLFGVAGTAVSVNGDQHVAELATVSYRGDDLVAAYRLGRQAAARPPERLDAGAVSERLDVQTVSERLGAGAVSERPDG